MKITLQFALILIIWQIGEWISNTFNLIIPGSILGMLLLLFLLESKIIKEENIRAAGDLFLKVLPFFFVPSGVAILAYTDLVKDIWVSMTLILVLSMALVMLVTGKTTQKLIDMRGDKDDH
ncbi:CidA/LrgA family protein [Clostridia bacterium]|nr:CidA/LrgA family protein [Clostridia bacterium]